jgi:hypothetical protein
LGDHDIETGGQDNSLMGARSKSLQPKEEDLIKYDAVEESKREKSEEVIISQEKVTEQKDYRNTVLPKKKSRRAKVKA